MLWDQPIGLLEMAPGFLPAHLLGSIASPLECSAGRTFDPSLFVVLDLSKKPIGELRLTLPKCIKRLPQLRIWDLAAQGLQLSCDALQLRQPLLVARLKVPELALYGLKLTLDCLSTLLRLPQRGLEHLPKLLLTSLQPLLVLLDRVASNLDRGVRRTDHHWAVVLGSHGPADGELPAVSLDTVLFREAGGQTAWKV